VLTIKPFSAGMIFSTPRQNFGKVCATTPEDHELARLTLAYLLSNKDISAVMVGMTLLSEVENNTRVPAERLAMLDGDARRKLDLAAERMWANLPPHYQWLKEWECV
jgi:predicted aldo/keto reductase-like oxidoreductase